MKVMNRGVKLIQLSLQQKYKFTRDNQQFKVRSNLYQSIDYKQILDTHQDLHDKIRYSFGPHTSGICVIKDVPGYHEARRKLLQLSNKLGQIPKENLNKLRRPESKNTIGWIHSFDNPEWKAGLSVGRLLCNLPQFKNGQFLDQIPNNLIDFNQFVNIKQDMLGLQTPNVWPQEIPELKQAFLDLSKILIECADLLTIHIDQYLSTILMSYPKNQLNDIIKNGSHSGTFFHYDSPENHKNEYTGYHTDYTALTAIVPGSYNDKNNNILECYEREGGLYYKTRLGDQHRVEVDKDSIVFTIGEVAQIISGGILEASPLRVKKPEKFQLDGVSRNSFAVRFKPTLDYKLCVPSNVDDKFVTKNQNIFVPKLDRRWQNCMTYGQFVLNCLCCHIRPKY